MKTAVIGAGRAGGALAAALTSVGWSVDLLGRGDDVSGVADEFEAVVIATPDAAISDVADSIQPGAAVVLHMSGATGLDVLAGHARVGSVHPLVALPSAAIGARRLPGAWFAVAGDPAAAAIVEALGGRGVVVADQNRAAYHAAACVASNHVVALLAQAERIAASADVPLEAYLDLVRATVDNVAAVGPVAALTGPAARGDDTTLDAHRSALDERELVLYDALAAECRRLAEEA